MGFSLIVDSLKKLLDDFSQILKENYVSCKKLQPNSLSCSYEWWSSRSPIYRKKMEQSEPLRCLELI